MASSLGGKRPHTQGKSLCPFEENTTADAERLAEAKLLVRLSIRVNIFLIK
jgi:hypothetical protein